MCSLDVRNSLFHHATQTSPSTPLSPPTPLHPSPLDLSSTLWALGLAEHSAPVDAERCHGNLISHQLHRDCVLVTSEAWIFKGKKQCAGEEKKKGELSR